MSGKEIDATEVKLGDTIELVYSQQGVKVSTEGVVSKIRTDSYGPSVSFYTIEGGCLGNTFSGSPKLYLIDRPKKDLPAEIGAVIYAKKLRGVEAPEGKPVKLMRVSEAVWACARRIEGSSSYLCYNSEIEDWTE